ncbi:membrane associated rhomboid family serine protease [Marinilabilia salmonicolor]|jgi:membrane associated rhomboid family serine protease|uniref:rhomboid family intramembrane serine protease n=1 Tax=Marinilabilia salmonicolor TaxID=989 RepID=UPI000D05281C|nr:rhomboid family intramembrane serine protease [Marinilabilia salmonicolor]PRY98333.1 membrane associated rhomboid family serine protease [Marinilabilia salmonicolor]
MTSLSEQHIIAERKKILYSSVFPLFLLLLMFLVHTVQVLEDTHWFFLGVKPLSVEGLPGVLLSPFIHADWGHLGANAGPFLVLTSVLFYVYRDIALKVFIWIYVLAGIWLWFGARDAWHVGASGLVYGVASFLFISGIIRNYVPLIALSMMVVFLYGSLFWGIFPVEWLVDYSWEAHMWGALAGVVTAVVFRKEGPQKPPPPVEDEWEEESEGESWAKLTD